MAAPPTTALPDEMYFSLLKLLSLLIGILPSFIGVGLGIREAAIGICISAEQRLDLSITILPLAFITASMIYSFIIFFTFFTTNVTSYAKGFRLLTSCAFTGIGGLFASLAIGGIARYATITRAQQKKFTTQFLLLMIFAELIGLFGMIMSIIYGFELTSNK